MTDVEFKKLAKDLQLLAHKIPEHWGRVQNDNTDSKIDMFSIYDYAQLEVEVQKLTQREKDYYRRRWYLWRCAQCDEYIFCLNNNVTKNPNKKDQEYDIEFNNDETLRFDVKGTVVPRDFRDNLKAIINEPEDLIEFFYTQQSKGVRNNLQNRLFIIHHSAKEQRREILLRSKWEYKEKVYKEYADYITKQSEFIKYKSCKVDIIYIGEKKNGDLTNFIQSK